MIVDFGGGMNPLPEAALVIDKTNYSLTTKKKFLLWNPDNLKPLQLRTNSISQIYSSHTLEHVHELEFLFKEFYRVLTKGGILKVIVPCSLHPQFHDCPFHVRPFSWGSFNNLCDLEVDSSWFCIPGVRFEMLSRKMFFGSRHGLAQPFCLLLRVINNLNPEFFGNVLVHLFPPYELEFIMKKVEG